MVNELVIGKDVIKVMFVYEFVIMEMVCILENIFEDGEWVIMEWKDLKEMCGCGFFYIIDDKIVF